MEVCGEADNVPDGVALIREKKPSVAIIDITLKNSSGLELLKDLRAQKSNCRCWFSRCMTNRFMPSEPCEPVRAVTSPNHEASSRVLTAMRQVLRGEIYLDRESRRASFGERCRRKRSEPLNPVDRLTDRELEVFESDRRGRTTREIGGRLHVGLTTVDTYRARIKEKLNLDNAAQLHAEASRWIQDTREFAASCSVFRYSKILVPVGDCGVRPAY